MQANLREHIEKIISLTDDEFAFVQSHFITKQFSRHEFLITSGQPVKHTYFVISGLIKLIHTDDNAKEHIVAFAMEDWWESDFQAFYKGTKATMSLQCLEDTTVLCLTLDGYNSLCSGLNKMEYFFLKKANAGHIAAQQRILSFLTSNARERYEMLLKRYPSLFQRVPKTQLASYLGVSRETLSRLST
ncbi:Crp/Fnr family transcriptional regulator [Flavobacterium rivuli WB 3.3-2 = DSM 21788]|uniref:Crp/Fnr family transcriptional regulator n=1 Tax=Flavobacterium rivuli WB 3.3-2 = DSM 21788 TaxID=1121895 RepID=A0A0A2M739_9FLAO|nr:Crp/Fnr family transcriptional regulator [Flavobacterium rivuli]KGO87238.1 Crp/Fnr family transcriptional regulator [Flavobacterium rivuli WB 3.3-2 = DSM 21788]